MQLLLNCSPLKERKTNCLREINVTRSGNQGGPDPMLEAVKLIPFLIIHFKHLYKNPMEAITSNACENLSKGRALTYW